MKYKPLLDTVIVTEHPFMMNEFIVAHVVAVTEKTVHMVAWNPFRQQWADASKRRSTFTVFANFGLKEKCSDEFVQEKATKIAKHVQAYRNALKGAEAQLMEKIGALA